MRVRQVGIHEFRRGEEPREEDAEAEGRAKTEAIPMSRDASGGGDLAFDISARERKASEKARADRPKTIDIHIDCEEPWRSTVKLDGELATNVRGLRLELREPGSTPTLEITFQLIGDGPPAMGGVRSVLTRWESVCPACNRVYMIGGGQFVR
jgi:hypothetical protein